MLLQEYKDLKSQLFKLRWLNKGSESTEEDKLLEEMDKIWSKLSDEDKATLNNTK